MSVQQRGSAKPRAQQSLHQPGAVQGAVRLVSARPPGRRAAVGSGAVAILLGMTAAGGLVLGGRRPNEWLHLIYALVALALIPLADSLTAHATPRRRALGRLLAGLVAAGVIARLFATS